MDSLLDSLPQPIKEQPVRQMSRRTGEVLPVLTAVEVGAKRIVYCVYCTKLWKAYDFNC